MRGTIKFVDVKSGLWGYIVPDDGGQDVHFEVRDFEGPHPGPADGGLPVEFDLGTSEGKPHATRPRLLSPPRAPSPVRSTLGAALTQWAFVPFIPFKGKDGVNYSTVTEMLARHALEERWHFGQAADLQHPYPILENYLRYTFVRLQKQGRVLDYHGDAGDWAAFNTGLVDNLYDPIYSLFQANRKAAQPWVFFDFCVPGKGPSGKQLTAVFDPLPEPATYFSSNFDMLLDTSRDLHVDYEHVILDGVREDRIPEEFLERHVPRGFSWKEYGHLDREERAAILGELAAAIDADVQCMRGIKNRFEDAKVLGEKRTRWNFKTAIPQYYPRFDAMSLLLPLALVNDEIVDIALVVTRNPSGSYQGRTVLPLDWAYQNARLVCRPDSDWLTPEMVRPSVPRGGDFHDE